MLKIVRERTPEIITEYYNKIDTVGAKETMKWILSE
jgi:hypothetical protein